MKHPQLTAALLSCCLLGFAAQPASADDDHENRLRAKLRGYQEVPAVSTLASGDFRATIHDNARIDYELSYRDLQAPVAQAHIHFGQRAVNGGISVWLCGTAALPGPAGTPVCPSTNPATVTGTITATNVIGPGGAQQLGAGELAELLSAIRAGVTYANVHTSVSPGGEIRGQIKADD